MAQLELDEKMKDRIDSLSREQMAHKWRFAPVGDPMFRDAAGEYFELRFKKLGGFSPEISKRIGW